MKGKIIRLTTSELKKTQTLTLEVEGDFRSDYDRLKGKDLDITIKRYRKKRSLDANAYAWVLLDKLSETLNIPKEDIYRNTIREIGGVSEIVCLENRGVSKLVESWTKTKNSIGRQAETVPSKLKGCTNVILYYGSSEYDTAQMSRLIDLLVEDCREQGIETLPTEKLDSLKEGWKDNEH